jgi:hypothetical protein
MLCIFFMVCYSWHQVFFIFFGYETIFDRVIFVYQKFGQLASLEIPFVESRACFFLLPASFVRCMENIRNIVAWKLSLAVCDQHSVAGICS